MPTYDDFHQMVLGADLKPMEKRNKGKVSMFEGLSVEKKSQYFGSDLYQQSARAEVRRHARRRRWRRRRRGRSRGRC